MLLDLLGFGSDGFRGPSLTTSHQARGSAEPGGPTAGTPRAISMSPYMEEHVAFLKAMHPNRRSVDKLHMAQFNDWFKERLRDVETSDPKVGILATGPTWEVRTFQG